MHWECTLHYVLTPGLNGPGAYLFAIHFKPLSLGFVQLLASRRDMSVALWHHGRSARMYETASWVEQFGIEEATEMMRNVLWIVGIGAVVWVGAHARAAVMAPLTTAFHATGAAPRGYSVNDWVEVGHSNQSLRQLSNRTARALHLAAPVKSSNGPAYQKLIRTRTVAGTTTRLIVERLSTGATFVVADRTSPHGFTGLRATEALFAHVLKDYGPVHSDINLEGAIRGHVSFAGQQALVKKGLSSIAASDVNGINTKGYVSMSAKSPFISGSDRLDGRPVNVQIAASYDSYLHETQVYVGTPLITVTY